MGFVLVSLSVLLITILVEFLVYWVVIKQNYKHLFVAAVFINMITVPLVYYLYQYMTFRTTYGMLIFMNYFVAEMFIVFLESILLMVVLQVKYLKSLGISALANLITATIGLMFFFM